MSHDATQSSLQVDHESAALIAQAMSALATPSRVLILGVLRRGPCGVSEIAALVGMEMSAVSHQLRVLRELGLVTPSRRGRNIDYALHDDHVALLIDQAVHHITHRRIAAAEPESGSTPPPR